jgi:hypothetical protein
LTTPTTDRRCCGLPLALAALAAALAGCASHSRVDGSWSPTASRQASYSRILVVGVSPDIDGRCGFEWALVSALRTATTQAVASCDAMPLKDPLTRETIEQTVTSLGADAVLATSLVSMKLAKTEGTGRDSRGDSYYKATDWGYEPGYYGGYGAADYFVVYAEFQTAPPLSSVQGDVQLVSRLYETRNRALVYTMHTQVKARDLESRSAGLTLVTAPIADRLHREGLTR